MQYTCAKLAERITSRAAWRDCDQTSVFPLVKSLLSFYNYHQGQELWFILHLWAWSYKFMSYSLLRWMTDTIGSLTNISIFGCGLNHQLDEWSQRIKVCAGVSSATMKCLKARPDRVLSGHKPHKLVIHGVLKALSFSVKLQTKWSIKRVHIYH